MNPSARTEAVTSLANVCGASMLDCLQVGQSTIGHDNLEITVYRSIRE